MEESVCPLCERPLPAEEVSLHHLVPKSQKGKETVALHRICHRKIHSLLDEKTIARQYATIEALRRHPEISRFVAWVSKRPPHFYAPTSRSRTKGRR